MKLTDLSLEALYSKPKITKAVQDAIVLKENFSQIVPEYCEKVCALKCKNYKKADLLPTQPIDVLIIQDYYAMRDTYKKGSDVEKIHLDIIRELQHKYLQGLSSRITTLLKCEPDDLDKTKPPKPPLQTKLVKCAPYLLSEIERTRPKVIISLSTSVTKALGLNYSNYTNRGEVHNNVVMTLHPRTVLMIRQNSSGAMWGTDYWGVLERDFDKTGRLARGELVIPDLDPAVERFKDRVHIVRSQLDIVTFYQAIKDRYDDNPDTIFSWDTETTGLDPWAPDAKLLTVQFGFRDNDGQITSYVFPLWHRDNKIYDPQIVFDQYIKPLLETLKLVGHNIKFDVLYTFVTTGVRPKHIVFDTMLLLHAVNSGIQGNYGLKNAVWDWWPQSGLGGYETLLPKLSTKKEQEEEEDASE